MTPTAIGFDYFYGIQASLDMAPYVYIENDRAVAPGTVTKAFFRKGAASADFDAMDCLGVWAEKSVVFLDERAKEPEKPFFLYLPLTSPHTPIVPSPDWQGKSEIGEYGDFLMETDWVVGEVLGALDKHRAGREDAGDFHHRQRLFAGGEDSGPGGERATSRTGTSAATRRISTRADTGCPLSCAGRGKSKPGSVTSRLTCQTDFTATCAEILGVKLAPDAGVDSVSFLPTLKDSSVTGRSAIVNHSIGGFFAIREGKWKLCLCPGSGGWSEPRPGKEPKGAPRVQLFDLDADPAEKNNLAETEKEKVAELTALLQSYADNGRSTPGEKQENDGAVDIWMGGGRRKD